MPLRTAKIQVAKLQTLPLEPPISKSQTHQTSQPKNSNNSTTPYWSNNSIKIVDNGMQTRIAERLPHKRQIQKPYNRASYQLLALKCTEFQSITGEEKKREREREQGPDRLAVKARSWGCECGRKARDGHPWRSQPKVRQAWSFATSP